jgi:hypothetical protein
MSRLTMIGSLLAWIPAAVPMAPGTAASAQDLNAHCASVGNDDRVKPIPEALVPEARRLFGGGPDQSATALQASTVFRCMSGQVWLCNHGANLTCAKGDARRVSKGAIAWCKDHPDTDVVPMVATGRHLDMRGERGAHRIVEKARPARVHRRTMDVACQIGLPGLARTAAPCIGSRFKRAARHDPHFVYDRDFNPTTIAYDRFIMLSWSFTSHLRQS